MVIFALLVPVLMLMMGLGVDVAHMFQERRDIQGVADLAALAGASQLPGDPSSAEAVAADIAVANGIDASAVTAVGAYDGDENRIEVSISHEVGLFFLPVMGLDSVTISTRAVAEHVVNTSTGILAKKDYHCWEGTVTIASTASNIVVDGNIHSNGGLTVRGSNNTVNGGKLTWKEGPPTYLLDGETDCGFENIITGTNPNIEIDSAPWQDWPVLYTGSDFPCTYNLGTNGDLERDGPWWEDGTMLPDKKLNPGVICVSGNNWLTLNENDVTGNVTFRGGKLDIRGSNTNFTAYANGVLMVSDSKDFPAMRLYPSGGRWEGMIYNRAWNTGNYVEGGQIVFRGSSGFQHIGPIIGWAVFLDGSNWSITGPLGEGTREPMRLVE
jgi:hypothetical protein